MRTPRDNPVDEPDRVADQRARAADERDRLADAREAIADAREALLDKRDQVALRHKRDLTDPVSRAEAREHAEALLDRSAAAIERSRAMLARQAAVDARTASVRRGEQAEIDAEVETSRSAMHDDHRGAEG